MNCSHSGSSLACPFFSNDIDLGVIRDGLVGDVVGLADGVHDLAEKFLDGDVGRGADVAAAFVHFPAEAPDFIGGHACDPSAPWELLASGRLGS